jgi:cystathionine beta-lyase
MRLFRRSRNAVKCAGGGGATSGGVVIPVPSYMGILSAPVKTARPSIHSPLCKSERVISGETFDYYEMDFEDMRRRAKEQNAAMLILCNPQNPVGRVYKKNELQSACDIARENNLLIVCDEIHSDLIFEGTHVPFFTLDDDYARENSITLMGPGKTYNIAGLPFGFAVIPGKKTRDEFCKAAYAISENGVMNLTAASVAYSGACDSWREELLAYLKGNRDFLEAGLRKISERRGEGIRITHCEGTYLQWIDFSGVLKEGENAYKVLLERAKVALNEGGMFYGAIGKKEYSAFARLNFATTRARLADAIKRIESIF